jgi:hypothetical protein
MSVPSKPSLGQNVYLFLSVSVECTKEENYK